MFTFVSYFVILLNFESILLFPVPSDTTVLDRRQYMTKPSCISHSMKTSIGSGADPAAWRRHDSSLRPPSSLHCVPNDVYLSPITPSSSCFRACIGPCCWKGVPLPRGFLESICRRHRVPHTRSRQATYVPAILLEFHCRLCLWYRSP